MAERQYITASGRTPPIPASLKLRSAIRESARDSLFYSGHIDYSGVLSVPRLGCTAALQSRVIMTKAAFGNNSQAATCTGVKFSFDRLDGYVKAQLSTLASQFLASRFRNISLFPFCSFASLHGFASQRCTSVFSASLPGSDFSLKNAAAMAACGGAKI